MTAQEQAGSEETPERTESADNLGLTLGELREGLVEWVAAHGSGDNAPVDFALGDAPDPQTWPDTSKRKPRKTGLATHTGTDPHGRAIGPAEDHTEAKRDYDGLTAAQAAEKAAALQKEHTP